MQNDQNSVPFRSAADDIIAELNTTFGYASFGPHKCFLEMTVSDIKADLAQNDVYGVVTLHSECEGTGATVLNGQKDFTVNLADLRRLGEAAPLYREDFAKAAETFERTLGFEKAKATNTLPEWTRAELTRIFDAAVERVNVITRTASMATQGTTKTIFAGAIEKIRGLSYPGKPDTAQ